MRDFSGKVVLVVAATRGIGLACAQGFAQGGARVYLGVRRLDAGQAIADELKAAGHWAEPVYFDAYEQASYETMVQTVVDKEGHIDILVNNFGGSDVKQDQDVVNTTVDYFNQNVNTNLDSVFLPSKYAVPHMPKGSAIINIGSIGGYNPDVTQISYHVSKAAIMSLTENIATQYARRGIRCNCVMPGMIATDALVNNMSQEFIDGFLKHVPLKRFGQPEDIANAVLFLASDEASFITGHCLPVAGGYRVPAPTYGDTAAKMEK